MGFFRDLWDGVCEVASTVVETVKTAALKAVEYAGKALSWIAETGEKVIRAVREIWLNVKPYLEKISNFILEHADKIPHPKLKAIALLIGGGIKALLALENSPVLKKTVYILEKFVLPMVGKLGTTLTTWAEIEQGKEHQKLFKKATEMLSNDEEKRGMLFAQIVNQFVVLNSETAMRIKENKVDDLEHYLQLRASHKVLQHISEKLTKGKSIEDITADDHFILEVTEKILGEESLTVYEAKHFETVVEERFGKELMAIVFEEMVIQWAEDLRQDINNKKTSFDRWNEKNTLKEQLEGKENFGVTLSPEERSSLKDLVVEVKSLKSKLDAVKKTIGHRQYYIEAAEGLLLTFEGKNNNHAELESEVGKDFIAAILGQVEKVAAIIIQCMQNERPWESLEEDEKSLIIDFSNIFRKASVARTKKLVEVAV